MLLLRKMGLSSLVALATLLLGQKKKRESAINEKDTPCPSKRDYEFAERQTA